MLCSSNMTRGRRVRSELRLYVRWKRLYCARVALGRCPCRLLAVVGARRPRRPPGVGAPRISSQNCRANSNSVSMFEAHSVPSVVPLGCNTRRSLLPFLLLIHLPMLLAVAVLVLTSSAVPLSSAQHEHTRLNNGRGLEELDSASGSSGTPKCSRCGRDGSQDYNCCHPGGAWAGVCGDEGMVARGAANFTYVQGFIVCQERLKRTKDGQHKRRETPRPSVPTAIIGTLSSVPRPRASASTARVCPPSRRDHDSVLVVTRSMLEQSYLNGFVAWYTKLGVECFLLFHDDPATAPALPPLPDSVRVLQSKSKTGNHLFKDFLEPVSY